MATKKVAVAQKCQNAKCGHDSTMHDHDGGFCNERILTVLDTTANCPCVGYAR